MIGILGPEAILLSASRQSSWRPNQFNLFTFCSNLNDLVSPLTDSDIGPLANTIWSDKCAEMCRDMKSINHLRIDEVPRCNTWDGLVSGLGEV